MLPGAGLAALLLAPPTLRGALCGCQGVLSCPLTPHATWFWRVIVGRRPARVGHRNVLPGWWHLVAGEHVRCVALPVRSTPSYQWA